MPDTICTTMSHIFLNKVQLCCSWSTRFLPWFMLSSLTLEYYILPSSPVWLVLILYFISLLLGSLPWFHFKPGLDVPALAITFPSHVFQCLKLVKLYDNYLSLPYSSPSPSECKLLESGPVSCFISTHHRKCFIERSEGNECILFPFSLLT